MKKLLLLPLLIFILTAFSIKDENVMICLSPNSYAWHSGQCRGLDKCTHKIITVSKSDAINKHGKTKPCGYCY